MRSSKTVVVAVVVSGFLAAACGWCAAGAEPPSRPADKADLDAVQWRFHSVLEDGRRVISDGGFLLGARYVPDVPVPEKGVAPQGVQRLLQSATERGFGMSDLERKAGGGNFVAPGGVELNRRYVECLRGSRLQETVRFRAKGANDPVLILDGTKVVGVMMPIKSGARP